MEKDNKNVHVTKENNDAEYNPNYDKDRGMRGHEAVMDRGHFKRLYKNLVIAIIVLSILLAGAMLVAINMNKSTNYYRTQLENQYERSFFNLTDNMNNIELRMSKLLISNSNAQMESNLYNIARQAENSQMSLAELPTSHETINKTMRFINQLGDFCNYCAQSLTKGKKLSEQQMKDLERLYRTNKSLTQELNIMASKLGTQMSVLSSYSNDNMPNNFADGIDGIQKKSDYPTIDYEGPFADEAENVAYNGLTGELISQQQAAERVKEIFGEQMPIDKLTFVNESSGKIATYNYNAKMKDGNTVYVQITQKGGHPLFIDNDRKVGEATMETDQCALIAEDFVRRIGYEDLQSVWTSDYKGNVFVNMAPVVNDAVIYSDMVKIIVAKDNGEILGLETIAYITNHSERDFSAPALSQEQAKSKVSSKIADGITGVRLAMIPVNREEILTWEITSDWEDLSYIIYLDANTGEEIEVFRVVENQEGTKLL